MLKIFVCAVIVGVWGVHARADFCVEFQEAHTLLIQNKTSEAHAAFRQLAEMGATPQIKAKCLAYAVTALSHDNQFDKALELANLIADKPISINAQMEVYLANRANGQLRHAAEEFKEEDIAAWPDNIDYKGFWNRGQILFYGENFQDAARDLNLAAIKSGSDTMTKIQALNLLGSSYRLLKDESKALDAYQQVMALNYGQGASARIDSVIQGAKILIKQANYEEALKTLALTGEITNGVWGFQYLETCGDVFHAQGKAREAVKKYDAALAIDGIPSLWVRTLREKRGQAVGEQENK